MTDYKCIRLSYSTRSLDLSAAFDTIDHKTLLSRLASRFGLTVIVLDWIKSYLTDHTQAIVIDDSESDPDKLLFRVSKGSVLGPILSFIISTSPLGDLLRQCCDILSLLY